MKPKLKPWRDMRLAPAQGGPAAWRQDAGEASMISRLWFFAAAAALLLGAGSVSSQTYPTKPVRIIVSAGPGGGLDIIARMLTTEFSRALGQQFIVENRPSSVVTADAVAKAVPDGHTLMFAVASYLVNGILYKDLPYDPQRDLAPISLIGSTPIIICSLPSLPVTTLAELVAYAKQKPGELNFGSGGIGSPLHLAGELFKQDAKVNIVHIAYKGTAPAALALISGEVQLSFPSVISLYPHIKSGKVRVLAVMGPHRSPTLPDVPTTAEAGMPGLTADIWYGLLAPKNTPRPIIDQLQRLVVKAIGTKEIRERLLRDDVEPIASTPDEFSAFQAAEYAKWSRVIRAANIKPE
jgi:tripartite-type tricarboxylate transporter receptor subunit TctC